MQPDSTSASTPTSTENTSTSENSVNTNNNINNNNTNIISIHASSSSFHLKNDFELLLYTLLNSFLLILRKSNALAHKKLALSSIWNFLEYIFSYLLFCLI